MNNLPVGWINNDLRTVLEKIIDYRGQSVPKADTGVPLITARNVKKGYLDFSSKEYVDESLYSVWMSRGVPVSTDILFTTEAPLGNACRYPSGEKYAIGQRIVCLRVKKNILDSDYLLYFLLSDHGQTLIDIKSSGSTAKGIKSSELKKIKLTYPESISEQIKIAEILSTWDNAINTVQKLLANSQQQKKALMQKLLTGKKRFSGFEGEWESVRLSKIANVSIGLVTTMTKFYVNSGVPLIRNSDIKPNRIQKNNMVFLCKDFAFENKHRRLVRGDIVTVHTGEVGVSAIINDDLDGCLGFATLNTRPNLEKVTSEYLCWYFNSSVFINWSIAISTGDGRQNLNLKDFVKAQILLPSIEEQQKIATILTTADQEIDNLCAQLNHLKQEKKALMQQLLTGKRRVKIEEAA